MSRFLVTFTAQSFQLDVDLGAAETVIYGVHVPQRSHLRRLSKTDDVIPHPKDDNHRKPVPFQP